MGDYRGSSAPMKKSVWKLEQVVVEGKETQCVRAQVICPAKCRLLGTASCCPSSLRPNIATVLASVNLSR
mgnify:CR=1 FL=1